MSDTPIYKQTIAEAKRKTKRGSFDHQLLVEMDKRTRPPGTIESLTNSTELEGFFR